MRPLTFLILPALLATGPLYAAGDPEAGRTQAATCNACHGIDGISPNPLWPNLAGQKAGYTAKQLRAFRDGSRQDTLMSPMAAGLSDQDRADLAAYYAGLR